MTRARHAPAERRFSTVVFEFGGVLTTPMDDTARNFARDTGLPEDAYRQTVAVDPAGRELYARLERGEITQERWNAEMGVRLGIDGTNLMGRALATLSPEESVVAAAAAIRAGGVRTAVLSNSMGLFPHNPYGPWQLEECHDLVVLSEQHGMRKPEPGIYALTLRLLGLPGTGCVFVDDNEENLAPARALGMTTVHATSPAVTVARLQQFLPHIPGLETQAEVVRGGTS
ncbi:HAD family hydrolase [Streptomyces qinzhouensis]|uniref:HAD family phosphatase n=1 Tax=Streptomyces qinzhouensis TaxID=2599401 RepID=A0A5B8IC42_9ACTN|nr:HAD family phosphatase [Streptomyces qinzhouensis]QDY75342.1 HAD family phosphatase [Streptomyces qinzhouensis]